jgi:hypothetical protein
LIPPDVLERAILAARAVEASDGAETLRKHSKGTAGTWDADDEARLREGWIQVWNPGRNRYDRLDVPVPFEVRR